MTADKKSNCHVYGYADYDVKMLVLQALINGNRSWKTRAEYTDCRRYWYYPVSEKFLEDNAGILFSWIRSSNTVKRFLSEEASVPSLGSFLYFTKQCRTPRVKFGGHINVSLEYNVKMNL